MIKNKKRLFAALLTFFVGISAMPGAAYAQSMETQEEVESTGTASPTNPVHHCVKDDRTDWSYVYFGSYPQTELTSASLRSEITEAEYDANGDAWVNGTKYRRISKGNNYRYFIWSSIRWRVLENNGSTLFVVADKALDCKSYNETNTPTTWENCTLRTWLNGTFYNTAFSSSEQEAIVQQTVVNDDNQEYGTEGGNNTQDKIYLLSIAEATNLEYGFCESKVAFSSGRRRQPSDYAHVMGAGTVASGVGKGNCSWWLRSPGNDTSYAAYVDYNGYISNYGHSVSNSNDAVAPALHINLSSDLWSTTSSKEIENPVHRCMKDDTDWSYVYFGSYPQTEVTGTALTTEITGAEYDANGDAWVNGTKYRRISKSDIYRYFKWERIKWRVLENNGSTLFIVADQGLDCKNYNETNTPTTWENCTLRTWLNESFYNTAFSSSEQREIVQQTVVNDDNRENGTEGGNNTQDNVYLLSIAEAENPEYGFCEYGDVYSASRWMQPSDYAHVMGATKIVGSDYKGSCSWWLRSPGNNGTIYAAYVSNSGDVIWNSYVVSNNYSLGVAPALQINLSSDLWSVADGENSGDVQGSGSHEESGNGETSSAGGGNGIGSGNSENGGNQNNQTTTIEQGNAKYTITDTAKKTVEYTALTSKNPKTVTIPAAITINNTAYTVTSIAAKAFKGNKTLTKVTIGKNVKTIGKQAFYNCKKLKKVTVKTTGLTAKTVGAKAFKGIAKKAAIKVPAKKLSAYKKILKKKGITGKAQKIKK